VNVRRHSEAPPPIIDGATVLEYAVIDDSVRFTGRLHLYHGEKRVGPVPRLAICKDPDMDDLLLFHCDTSWSVQAAQIWNAPGKPAVTSVDEVKRRAEEAYSGLAAKWVRYEA
jgi:hypothetical protein